MYSRTGIPYRTLSSYHVLHWIVYPSYLLFCSSHSSELLYAADTGNDYNYIVIEERRDGAVSRVVYFL